MNTYLFKLDNSYFMQRIPVPIYNIVSFVLKKFTVFH